MLLISFVAFALFRNSISNPTSSNITAPKKELTLWVQEPFQNSDSYFNGLIHKYNKLYPNVTFNYEVLKGSDQRCYNYMMERLINGHIPDVLLLSHKNFKLFADQDKLLSLAYNLQSFSPLLPSTYQKSSSDEIPFGIAYFLNPEILVYNKKHDIPSHLSAPDEFTTSIELLAYMSKLQHYYNENNISYTAFSIPSLIENGEFILSLNNTPQKIEDYSSTIMALLDLQEIQKTEAFSYSKKTFHPFFDASVTFSLEPLSLIYEHIDSNYNLKDAIGIYPLASSGLESSHSKSHYISLFKDSKNISYAQAFLELFISDEEILNRYKFHKAPIISYSLKDHFIQDTNYDNVYIWDYLELSQPSMSTDQSQITTKEIDDYYNKAMTSHGR